ncbi:hypothetical protein [Piscinibacter terrae]|nr:hypothetical protein [Albitalea terrae]
MNAVPASLSSAGHEKLMAARCGVVKPATSEEEGISEDIRSLLDQIGKLLLADMKAQIAQLTSADLGAAKTQDTEEPPPPYHEVKDDKPPAYAKAKVKTEAPAAEAEPSPEQAKVNQEKLQGIGNHPLGPDDKLLPPSDKRTAQQVLDSKEGAILKNLGNQEGVRDKLKQTVGDFESDPQAAARGIAYLRKIKNMPNPDGSKRPDDVTQNDKVEGATKDGDIRSGTELAILKDSFKGGPQVPDKDAPATVDKSKAYAWMNSQKALAPTNDPHVKNGGNFVSDAAVIGQKILNGLADVFDFAGKLFSKTIGKIPGLGKIAGFIGDTLAGAAAGGLRVAGVAAVGGDVGAAAKDMGKDMLQNTVENVVGIVDPTGLAAKKVGEEARKGLDQAIPSTNDGDKSKASGYDSQSKPQEQKPQNNQDQHKPNHAGKRR